MKALALALILLPALGHAQGSATLNWQPTLLNTDGSAAVLTGYKVYYGTSPTALTQTLALGKVTTTVITGLAPATWTFAVTAVNTAGVESSRSNVASKTIQGTPTTPVTIGGPVFNPSSTTDSLLPLEVGSVVAGKPCDASQQFVFGGKTYMIVVNAKVNVTPLPETQVVAALAVCQ